MPRHQTVALSAETTARQSRIATVLGARQGEVVSLTYVKRDSGRTSSSVGPVVEVGGLVGFSNGHVVIDTSETKGRPSSVNLHLILTIDGERV